MDANCVTKTEGGKPEPTEIQRLRAEVRDLKARLRAARPYIELNCPTFTQHDCKCAECCARRATDIRNKNWRKP
jgi:hypothetical protein